MSQFKQYLRESIQQALYEQTDALRGGPMAGPMTTIAKGSRER